MQIIQSAVFHLSVDIVVSAPVNDQQPPKICLKVARCMLVPSTGRSPLGFHLLIGELYSGHGLALIAALLIYDK